MKKEIRGIVIVLLYIVCILFVACNENLEERNNVELPDSLGKLSPIPFDYAYSFNEPIKDDSIRQNELARFIITDAESSGNDVTTLTIMDEMATVFYTINSELYMANVSFRKKSQSWGRVFLVDTCLIQTSSSITETINFRWLFYNSYDSIKGICNAEFSQKSTPIGVFSKLKLNLRQNDSIIYKGYKANSIDTLRFYNIIN